MDKDGATQSPVWVVDFDGTLALHDVGDELCDSFADPAWRDVGAAWRRGELTLPEAQRRMWASVRVDRETMVRRAFLTVSAISMTSAPGYVLRLPDRA